MGIELAAETRKVETLIVDLHQLSFCIQPKSA